MKVKELIEELLECDPEAEIFRYDSGYEWVIEIEKIDNYNLRELILTQKHGTAYVIY